MMFVKSRFEYVRGKIADYLNDLTAMGVGGFRFDAAKHMDPEDLAAIIAKVKGGPYIFQEVIAQDPSEPIKASQYFDVGDVTEFNYGLKVGEHFRGKNKIKYLKTFGESWGLMPSGKAVVFTDNHDSQRGHGGGGNVLTFRASKLYELANIFMLAWPYGYPKIMSSYQFSNSDMGPPSSSPYVGSKISCGFDEPWKCEHRWTPIANMVAFRNAAASKFAVTDFWSNGNSAIAFGRADRGFVVINREDFGISETFSTSMSPGTYCNVIVGELKDGKCSGASIVVEQNGQARITVPAMSAAAIHVAAVSTDSPSSVSPKTAPEVFRSVLPKLSLRGTFNGWKTEGMSLIADHMWTIDSISFRDNENARFKFDVYGDWSKNYGDDNGDGVGDDNGKDIPVTESEGPFTITFSDTSRKYTISQSKQESELKEELR